MTREEELDWLYRLRSEIYVYMPREWLIPMKDALKMAIKALEQEPFINKPCVSSGVCEHDKNAVIDKIRAEIEQLPITDTAVRLVTEIHDKHRAESEPQESEE